MLTISQTIEKEIGHFKLRCNRKVLRIPWTKKVKNTGILQNQNNTENWVLNSILTWKLKYFDHIKSHNGLEKTVVEGMVSGSSSRGLLLLLLLLLVL